MCRPGTPRTLPDTALALALNRGVEERIGRCWGESSEIDRTPGRTERGPRALSDCCHYGRDQHGHEFPRGSEGPVVAATISSLDASAEEQRKVREIVSMFSQSGTQDEMGGRRIVVAE